MTARTKIALLLGVSFTVCWAIVLSAFAQTPSSSSPTNKAPAERSMQTPQPPTAKADYSKNTWELPDDASKTKNPVPTSEESIAKGKELYLSRDKGNCVFCHGETGAGNEANMAKLRRKPANLSSKERMAEMTDGELFWKISKGISQIMPAGEKRMTEEERWHVVNYIRTLVKEKQ